MYLNIFKKNILYYIRLFLLHIRRVNAEGPGGMPEVILLDGCHILTKQHLKKTRQRKPKANAFHRTHFLRRILNLQQQ